VAAEGIGKIIAAEKVTRKSRTYLYTNKFVTIVFKMKFKKNSLSLFYKSLVKIFQHYSTIKRPFIPISLWFPTEQ
jgi:hypothetical protein